jgi:hypothetical protein
MTAGLAFGGCDTGRDFGRVDMVSFLTVRAGDFHLVGSGFWVYSTGFQDLRSLSHIMLTLSNFSQIGFLSAIFCPIAALSPKLKCSRTSCMLRFQFARRPAIEQNLALRKPIKIKNRADPNNRRKTWDRWQLGR